MKIVFICGSLEPGCDGVGDYTRRLAGELNRQGHHAAVLAINDRKIKVIYNGIQYIEGTNVPVLRIPSFWTSKEQYKIATKWLVVFNPSWISLQFVPFAFHNKGLPFMLGQRLKKMGKQCHWHIMFHELWVGMNKESSITHCLWGWVQKRLIISLVKKIKPSVIHTQTKLYLTQLQNLGFAATYFPLFSNIPVSPCQGSNVMSEESESFKKITFVLFATIHPGAPASEFAKNIASISKQTGIEFLLIIIGRCGPEKEKWIKAWAEEELSIEIMGEQSPEFVSTVFSHASIGLTTTPFVLAEKSGSVSAMLEHALPVLCVSYPWTPRKIKDLQLPDGITQYSSLNIKDFICNRQPVLKRIPLSELSFRFTELLRN